MKYRWHWNPKPWPPSLGCNPMAGRKGQPCDLICVGSLNSALIRFADGFTVVADRRGLRKKR